MSYIGGYSLGGYALGGQGGYMLGGAGRKKKVVQEPMVDMEALEREKKAREEEAMKAHKAALAKKRRTNLQSAKK